MDRWGTLLSSIRTKLEEARSIRGTNRHALFNEQSHQRTPAFMHSVIQNALESVTKNSQASPQKMCGSGDSNSRQPPGGFTDVGQHTGGTARCTTWPLVLATVRVSTVCMCNMCVYICVCVRVRVYVYACARTQRHRIHIHTCIHTPTSIMHTYMRTNIYVGRKYIHT
jgi:hypothetical protein